MVLFFDISTKYKQPLNINETTFFSFIVHNFNILCFAKVLVYNAIK